MIDKNDRKLGLKFLVRSVISLINNENSEVFQRIYNKKNILNFKPIDHLHLTKRNIPFVT